MDYAYDIIIDCGILAPGYDNVFVYLMNPILKNRTVLVFVATLPGTKVYDNQVVVHTSTYIEDRSINT